MAVTGGHCCLWPRASGATFPVTLQPAAFQATIGVFTFFAATAINSLYGPNKTQHLEEPKEEYWQKTKKVQRLHVPPWVYLPSFRMMILVILRAQFYSYEKRREIPSQKLLRKLDPAPPENTLCFMYSPDWHPILPGSFSIE